MAVLHYINHTHDALVVGYPPEPLLALGATSVWHQTDVLEHYLLPGFERFLTAGDLVVDNLSLVVTRIFLLLAMDATALKLREKSGGTVVLDGSLCAVSTFLKTLDDGSPLAQSSWVNEWKEWKLSFIQFTELRAVPTEKTLWYLLSRRAAGVVRLGASATHLVIPIFCEDSVSCIFVRAMDEPPRSGTLGVLTQADVFDVKSGLLKMLPRRIIQLAISKSTHHVPEGMYEEGKDALWLRGICEDQQTRGQSNWPFLSSTVSLQLMKIATTSWKGIASQIVCDRANLLEMEKGQQIVSLMPPEATVVGSP